MHGIHTNAIYGFLNIYWMIEKEFDPDYVAVAFDLRAPTFRHKMYSEYKATRKGMPDELKEQLPVIKEVLTAMNIPILEKEGYEADDILGTVANKNTKKEIFTYILTGDKDALQLISKTTSVINPTTRFGKTEYTVYTPEVLMQKQGIEPYQVVHIKSLMGDSSDNIPGVKGIGEKTAYSLIQKYVTLENIYNNIDTIEVTSKIKEKLTNDKEMAFLSQKLAKIDIDVPIDINYDSCKKSDVDLKKLYRLFKKLEFTKFLSKYDFSSVLTGIEEIDDKKDTNVEYDLTVEKVIKIDNKNFEEYKSEIFEVFKEDKVSYLFNGVCNESFTPNIYLDNKKVIAFYSFSKNYIYVIDFTKINTDSLYKLLEEFAVSNCIKLGYNIKQDILFLFNSKINDVKNFSYDIMIAYYLMDSIRGNYLIDFIFSNLFDVEIKKTNVTKQKQLSFFEAESEDVTLTDDEIYNIVTYLKGIYLSYDIVYNKLKEFEKNDMKKVWKKGFNVVKFCQKIDGYVRFECEIKKKKLLSVYKKKQFIRVSNLDYKELENIWCKEFMKMLKFDLSEVKKVKEKDDVLNRLKFYYKERLACVLYNFYLSIKVDGYDNVKEYTNEATFYRKISQLKKAGIDFSGTYQIFDENSIIDFDPFCCDCEVI